MLSWFRRWPGVKSRPSTPVPEPSVEYDPIDALRAHIRVEVAGGFSSEDAILQDLAPIFEHDMDPAIALQEGPRLLREALVEQAAMERSWPSRTDCDRLDAAFATLEADGVIARQNFSCCGNCGSSEIWDEIAEAKTNGRPARGYAFFHGQDTDSAVEGHGLSQLRLLRARR